MYLLLCHLLIPAQLEGLLTYRALHTPIHLFEHTLLFATRLAGGFSSTCLYAFNDLQCEASLALHTPNWTTKNVGWILVLYLSSFLASFLPQCLHAPYPLFTLLFYFLNVYYHGWMGDQWEPSDSAVFGHLMSDRASDAFGVCA
jgi:hypothetical protein